MHKKHVPRADQEALNILAKPGKRNNGFDVKHVTKLLSGRIPVIKNIVKNIGSNFGLKKVTVFVSCVNCQDIAILNLKASKNIGSARSPKNQVTINRLNMSSMTAPIFIKTAASSIL
jgi:hypothetical protein